MTQATSPQTITPTGVSEDPDLDLPPGRLLLNVFEAAEILAVKPSTIYDLCKSGELTGVYLGPKTLRIRPADLVSYVEGLPTERPEFANSSTG